MLTEWTIICPYCWESLAILVDQTAGDQRYVEDCQVCCRPIVIDVQVDVAGEVADVQATSEHD